MKRKQMRLWWLFIICWPVLMIAQQQDTLLNLPDLVQEGLDNNPDVRAAYHRWKANEAKIPQAGALPDPQLSFNLMNLPVNTFDFDQEPMTGKQLALMQMFPFPGKLGLKEDIAREGAGISGARYQEIRNQLVKHIKLTYFDIFYIDKAIETTRKNTDVLNDFSRIAASRYSVGKGIQQDVLRAQVELSKMEDKLISLRQKREALEAKLNALLNRPPATPVGKPVEPTADSIKITLSRLRELADQNRPLLNAWQAMIRQSEHRVRLAKKGYLPDFKLGVAYTQREVLRSGMGGIDFFSGMVTMNLPLYFWRKQNKSVEEAQYSSTTVSDKYSDVHNQVYSDLERTLSEARKNYRLLNLYQTGIIPQATQSLNSAIAGYQTDKVDFLTLLNNQITLFNFQLEYYRVLSDYNRALAELEAITGIVLSEID